MPKIQHQKNYSNLQLATIQLLPITPFWFCKYRCRYCFHYELSVKKDEDLMKHYVEALEQEMQLFRSDIQV